MHNDLDDINEQRLSYHLPKCKNEKIEAENIIFRLKALHYLSTSKLPSFKMEDVLNYSALQMTKAVWGNLVKTCLFS